MRHGVEDVIAQIVIQTAMPAVAGLLLLARLGWAVFAQAEVARLDLELVAAFCGEEGRKKGARGAPSTR